MLQIYLNCKVEIMACSGSDKVESLSIVNEAEFLLNFFPLGLKVHYFVGRTTMTYCPLPQWLMSVSNPWVIRERSIDLRYSTCLAWFQVQSLMFLGRVGKYPKVKLLRASVSQYRKYWAMHMVWFSIQQLKLFSMACILCGTEKIVALFSIVLIDAEPDLEWYMPVLQSSHLILRIVTHKVKP